MAKSLREIISGKSDEGLMDYLSNFNKYTPESITAARDELRRRGKQFSGDELREIDLKIQERTTVEADEAGFFGTDSGSRYVVTDSNAPVLYSKGAIMAFSVVFSTIFGAVLLSSNLSDKKRRMVVIGFGIVYTAATIVIQNLLPPERSLYILLMNAGGGLGLTSTFWDKYVGKETIYRAKPIWKALVISILVSTPFVLAIIYG